MMISRLMLSMRKAGDKQQTVRALGRSSTNGGAFRSAKRLHPRTKRYWTTTGKHVPHCRHWVWWISKLGKFHASKQYAGSLTIAGLRIKLGFSEVSVCSIPICDLRMASTPRLCFPYQSGKRGGPVPSVLFWTPCRLDQVRVIVVSSSGPHRRQTDANNHHYSTVFPGSELPALTKRIPVLQLLHRSCGTTNSLGSANAVRETRSTLCFSNRWWLARERAIGSIVLTPLNIGPRKAW